MIYIILLLETLEWVIANNLLPETHLLPETLGIGCQVNKLTKFGLKFLRIFAFRNYVRMCSK